jgi:hypothetical protein
MSPFDKAQYDALAKGLEIGEVALSALERTWRMDAEFYERKHLETERLLKAKAAVSLPEFAFVSDGNHMGISDDFCAKGIPYYRGGDIKEFFLSFACPEYSVPESIYALPTMIRSHMKKGDVFVSIVGAIIGQIGMKTDDVPALCSCKLAILRPKVLETSAYLAIFLSSDFGQSQIGRYRRGSAQTGLILEDFEQLLIPQLSSSFYSRIESVVTMALNARQNAIAAMNEAQQHLLAELGFANWTPSNGGASVKKYSDFVSAGRFDAEYFQPKYEDIVWKIQAYQGGVVAASNELVTGLVNESALTPERYIELADIGINGEIVGSTAAAFGDLPSRARQRVEAGQVIVSSVEGSLDSCALVMQEYDQALCSTGFHRFRSKAINPETLLLLFKSWPIQQLMKRGCSGTILSAILPGELDHVPLPLVDTTIQQELAGKVQSSFALRAESNRLLDLAKRAVEVAIEKGEETAMEYIEKRRTS